ncbi:MAG: response regulator transcription factor [Niabella sp.]|nr:response regulator transcription factor [Niabella sp.]
MDIQKEEEVSASLLQGKNGKTDFYKNERNRPSDDRAGLSDDERHASKKITIAIADDSVIQHKIWGLLINRNAALELVCLAYNGQDLIRQIETSAMLPDICILDLEMPVMNGLSTAKRLSQRFPTIKVFGYTSSEDEHMKKEMLKSNVVAIFSKTENRNLLHTIQSINESGNYRTA